MKNAVYGTIIFVVVFFTAGFLFRQWMDTRIYTSKLCMHPAMTRATLENKAPIGVCYWRVGDSRLVEEHWFNCEQYEAGETVDWEYTNYSCDDLVKTSVSLP